MIVVGLDFETTGLHPSDRVRVVEIAAHLYDIANGKSLAILNTFVHYSDGHTIPQAMTDIHGISQEMYETYGMQDVAVWKQFMKMAKVAEAVMAHNAAFEHKFLKASFTRAGLMLPKIKWVDTCTDLPFPANIKSRKLEHLAAAHKVRLVNAHRALPDVNAMLAIAQQYDVEKIRQLSADPNVKVQALVTKLEKDKAKCRGFRWDPDRKIWWRNMKQAELDKCKFDFKTKVLNI